MRCFVAFAFHKMKILLIIFLLFERSWGVNLNGVAAVGLGVLDFALKIADIVNMATDDHAAQSQEVTKQLDNFKNDMNEGLKKIEFRINGITLDAQLALDEKHIGSCFKDFEYFMNSKAIPEKDKLVACGEDVRKEFRQVAQIAKEEPYKLTPSKIYQDTVEHEGFCNTTNLVNIHNYLIQLYIKGCTTGIMSERIRTNGSSNVIYNECQSNIHNITMYFDSVLGGCFKTDTCDMVVDFIKSVFFQREGKQELDEYIFILRERFPWYNFLLFKAFQDPNVEVYGSDGDKPSVTWVTVGDIFFVVLWTPFPVQPKDSNSFRIVLDTLFLNTKYIGMNVKEETMGMKLVISGHLDHENKPEAPNQQCTDEVTNGTLIVVAISLFF